MERVSKLNRRTALTIAAGAPALALAKAAWPSEPTVGAGGPTLRAADFGLTGHYSQDATAQLQAMFDQAPPGALVEFSPGMDEGGDYRVTQTIVIRKHLSLRGYNSRIVGDMRDEKTDLIRYEPLSELRGVEVQGLRLGFNAGGRDALVFAGGDIGVIGNVISRCTISGGPGGYALRLTGFGNHFNVVKECTLIGTDQRTGAVLIATADGNKLHDNVIGGIGTGVRLELVNGAFKTGILGGAIVSRDGGIRITAGQQIDIERVQFEQGTGNEVTDRNQSDHKSHILIEGSGALPDGEEVRDVRIIACNFGSGTNQAAAVSLVSFARDVFLDENYFASLGTERQDIVIHDASVQWTRVGHGNRVGGARAGIVRGARNRVNAADLLYVRDRGTGTYGVQKSSDALRLTDGWTALPGFLFWKTADDILRFRSALKASSEVSASIVGYLPPGFRPQDPVLVSVPSDAPEQAVLAIAPDGEIRARQVVPGSIIYLDQLSLPIVGRPTYLSGPY